MKKLLLTSGLLAIAIIVLGGMDVFKKMEEINFVEETNSTVVQDTIYAVKYVDCILEDDFPEGYLLFTHDITDQHDITEQHEDWDLIGVTKSIKKYTKSLDSTLENLSSVDAHDFIHQAFQKSKNAVKDGNISSIQKHYHGEIMRICYDRDKALNQIKPVRL